MREGEGRRRRHLSAFAIVVNAPRGGPVVTLAAPPATAAAPPYRQDGVSVHCRGRERERGRRDSGGGRRNLGRARQPPLVLKPATTRSGLIYRERRRRKRGGGGAYSREEGVMVVAESCQIETLVSKTDKKLLKKGKGGVGGGSRPE